MLVPAAPMSGVGNCLCTSLSVSCLSSKSIRCSSALHICQSRSSCLYLPLDMAVRRILASSMQWSAIEIHPCCKGLLRCTLDSISNLAISFLGVDVLFLCCTVLLATMFNYNRSLQCLNNFLSNSIHLSKVLWTLIIKSLSCKGVSSCS